MQRAARLRWTAANKLRVYCKPLLYEHTFHLLANLGFLVGLSLAKSSLTRCITSCVLVESTLGLGFRPVGVSVRSHCWTAHNALAKQMQSNLVLIMPLEHELKPKNRCAIHQLILYRILEGLCSQVYRYINNHRSACPPFDVPGQKLLCLHNLRLLVSLNLLLVIILPLIEEGLCGHSPWSGSRSCMTTCYDWPTSKELNQ